MICTDFYRFAHRAGTKSKGRIDCVASTNSYNPFETLRNNAGELFMYIGDNTHTEAGNKGKSDLALSKGVHISSIYRPEIETDFGFGDVKNTTDALLFIFHNFNIVNGAITEGSEVEIIVARGMRKDRQNLYTLLLDGDLNAEIELLRQQASNVNSI